MTNVDSPGSKQQRRRWSVGRSSTPRSHFSLHSSEAFYASVEPLSGGRGGRALHNANGSGPDPDSNSVLDSCVPEPGNRQQYRTSVRRSSQDVGDRRAIAARNDRESFYTVPRDLAISRKEILRRRCVKDDVETIHLIPEKDPIEKRPRTLPSIGRRTRQDTERTSSLLKRVSRQDILRRRASIETNSQSKNVARTSSSFPNSSRPVKEDRDVSRPSTLPKILHASRTSRLEEYSSSRTRETAGREAPIYGRIRRRKMSLPIGAATLRDSTTPSSTLTRFSRTRASGERADTSKVVRHLRDPVPDPPDQPRCTDEASRDDIYVKVTRKVSRQTPHEERLESMDRTMSRRRIISNVDHVDSLERRMHQDRDQDVVRIKHDAILVSKADIDRLRNFKTRRNDFEDARTSCRDSTWSTRKDSKTDSWSRNKCPLRDSTWTSDRQTRCRPKSQSELLTKGQTEGSKMEIRSTTLPSYMKIRRKTSTGNLPMRNVDEQRRTSTSGVLTKQSKERSNYVRKTATHVPTHVRTFSDTNSVHSNSPDTSSSIFGFCTGKRRTQASSVKRKSPSWNLKTVRDCLWTDSRKY